MKWVRMQFWVRLALGVAVVCLLGASARSQPAARTNARGEAVPLFPYQNGWLGADAAYSIPLGSGQSLWLFCDTFVGSRGARTRAQRTGMPRNSIGISQCDNQQCTMRYYWNRMYQPHP